ncbi:MAG: N-acetyl-gamma-glutamyl-phosphate reductase [Deltaproteobacteria bacterium]|nr:N-acetyl-gamma-glutamyl-phosphate reductase [Deltaproteobacteria bacterium]
MIKAAVIGATGYTGLELVRILLTHPHVELTVLTSRSQVGTPYSELFPLFKGMTSLKVEEFDAKKIAGNAHVAFTALPHGYSMESVANLVEEGIKVVDLSADFRFSNLSVYKDWYAEHQFPNLAGEAVYGLPELNREKIRTGRLIGNPGCYPTSVILALAPFINENILDKKSIVVNSASGVSGAGRSASLGNIFCEANESYKAYKVGGHRHLPEIEEILGSLCGEDIPITFTPHLLPMNRGILSTITASLTKDASTGELIHFVAEHYRNEPFVRVCSEGKYPDTAMVRGSNYCDIGLKVDERTGRLIIVSAIDNLVKGASGQAIQNMNIICGLNEDEGLKGAPLSL